jgi:hypothetical protein
LHSATFYFILDDEDKLNLITVTHIKLTNSPKFLFFNAKITYPPEVGELLTVSSRRGGIIIENLEEVFRKIKVL